MTLNRFSDYALRTLIFAAVHRSKPFSVLEVSDTLRLSRHHMAKVVHRLAKDGLLHAKRGPRGGITLAVDPASVRIGALIRTLENRTGVVECLGPGPGRCRLTPACRLKGVLASATEAFFRELDSHTLADLMDNRTALAALIPLNS
jgi:Rrf2 family transcriptional regulator, nitric oxide-sensitive transcriptional repressor